MRLEILNKGYPVFTRLLFAIIKVASRYPVPDAAKLVFYRPGFYGTPMKKFTHKAMRGPSSWSIGDRELMAAYVSRLNDCTFCIKAHSAVATRAYDDGKKVQEVLVDLKSANIAEPLRATLYMLGKLTLEHSINAADIRATIASGVSYQQIEDALAVCFAFNTTNRLADAFDFFILPADGFESGAKYLLKRGYR